MRYTVLTLLLASSALGGCSMIQQARLNTAQQEMVEEMPQRCGIRPIDKTNVASSLACHDDLMIEKYSAAGYPYMSVLYALKADNQATAAALADGRITQNEARAQIDQHIAQATMIAEQLDAQASAARAERMARVGQALSQASAQFNQQQMMNRPVTTNCNSLGSSVNCTTW